METRRDRIFLTPEKAVAAIRRDFHQYPPQALLFSRLYPMLMGPESSARIADQGIWIHRKKDKSPHLAQVSEVMAELLHALENTDVGLDLLAKICTRIFRTRAYPGEEGGRPGVWIETGMEGFSCRLCGRCCRRLDFRSECTPADYAVWKAAGRTDIMRCAAPVEIEGKVTGYNIWVRPGTRQFSDTCPWLVRGDSPDRWVCGIQEIKPAICRQYPGSRKHAEITGCPGFG
jgi:Fe-S-cluster containining protein